MYLLYLFFGIEIAPLSRVECSAVQLQWDDAAASASQSTQLRHNRRTEQRKQTEKKGNHIYTRTHILTLPTMRSILSRVPKVVSATPVVGSSLRLGQTLTALSHHPSATRVTLTAPTTARLSSSGNAYDKSNYQNMPAEPQYELPNDAPPGTFELFYFALRQSNTYHADTSTISVSTTNHHHQPDSWLQLSLFSFHLSLSPSGGRAEQVRLLLTECGLPYQDRLLTQWQLRKLKAVGSPISNPNFLAAQQASPLPFGGLPLLRKGDLFLGQTTAILQYIAEEGKLWPETPAQRARAQMIVAGAEDLFQQYWPIKLDQSRYMYHSGSFPLTPGTNADYVASPSVHLKGPFDQYSVPRSFRRETLPRWLTFFESLLSTSEGGSEYFVGGKLSYADIIVYAHLQACQTIEKDCLQNFPLLAAHYQRIGARPKIKAYVEARPQSGL